jgi:CRP/FNR family transcriptional regulator, cyclic AMP receptor protein
MMIDIDSLLSWGATYRKVQKGEIIFMEGSSANFYYQLIEGKVKWVNINEDGRELIQLLIEEGESFGEIPLFDDEPYVATAVAETDSLIIRLHKNSFQQLLKENQELHLEFTKMMAKRLRYKFFILKELAFYDPEHRISALLNYEKRKHQQPCAKSHLLQLTRQQIADMTGLRVETVIRAIRHMHDKGEVLIQRGKVYC